MKYNDPIYIKMEKLDIMIRLTNQSNIAQVLSELKVKTFIFASANTNNCNKGLVPRNAFELK